MMDFMNIFSVVMVFPSDALLEEMFKESDDEHDRDPHGHPEKLEDETDQISSLRFTLEWVGVTRGELRHHVHQGLDIERHQDIGTYVSTIGTGHLPRKEIFPLWH